MVSPRLDFVALWRSFGHRSDFRITSDYLPARRYPGRALPFHEIACSSMVSLDHIVLVGHVYVPRCDDHMDAIIWLWQGRADTD